MKSKYMSFIFVVINLVNLVARFNYKDKNETVQKKGNNSRIVIINIIYFEYYRFSVSQSNSKHFILSCKHLS